MFKLEFYTAPILKYHFPLFYRYDVKKDEWWTSIIEKVDKIHYDQPLTIDEIINENSFNSMDIDKKFNNELDLKNWLIDKNYSRLHKIDIGEIYSITLNELRGTSDLSSVIVYAIWRKVYDT